MICAICILRRPATRRHLRRIGGSINKATRPTSSVTLSDGTDRLPRSTTAHGTTARLARLLGLLGLLATRRTALRVGSVVHRCSRLGDLTTPRRVPNRTSSANGSTESVTHTTLHLTSAAMTSATHRSSACSRHLFLHGKKYAKRSGLIVIMFVSPKRARPFCNFLWEL